MHRFYIKTKKRKERISGEFKDYVKTVLLCSTWMTWMFFMTTKIPWNQGYNNRAKLFSRFFPEISIHRTIFSQNLREIVVQYLTISEIWNGFCRQNIWNRIFYNVNKMSEVGNSLLINAQLDSKIWEGFQVCLYLVKFTQNLQK